MAINAYGDSVPGGAPDPDAGGGISALGLFRPARFDIFIDESARSANITHMSVGVRGIDLTLDFGDLLAATDGAYARAC